MKEKARVLGIAESFLKKNGNYARKSLIVGVVMRGDLQIDGLALTTATLGGLDATERIIDMITRLRRPDIRAVMLGGVAISLYNIIDLHELHRATGLPIIAVTYREGSELERALFHQREAERRLQIYRKNGPRIPLILKNGYRVFVRVIGISLDEAKTLLDRFTIHGRYPEPIRVAKLIAKSLLKELRILAEDFSQLFPDACGEFMSSI